MISQRTIEEVKDRASLLEIAGEFTKLRRQGSSYVGTCPFHAEKTGSFHIRDNGKFYHCFGCGVSGTAISFIMEARGLAFPDAIEELAARFGVRVEYEGKRAAGPQKLDKEKFYKINKLAQHFYQRELNTAPLPVKEYLKDRGVTREALAEFGVGFASNDREKLLTYLKSQKAPEELIIASGLARRNKQGVLYDTFRARLVFPIFVERKLVAGFGGRIIPALLPADVVSSVPKYLNSPETPIYEKNRILYGLPHALETVRREKELYLVEGYMDVIGLWQAGVKNAAATCGTAVTDNHVRRLAHLVQRLVLLFDGDSAGLNAAGKSFTVFLNSGIDCSAAFLPDGEDPDTLALKHLDKTAAALKALKHTPLFDSYIDFVIRKYLGKDQREIGAAAKGKIAAELAEVISNVRNSIERAELVERAALKLRVEANILSDTLKVRSAVNTTESKIDTATSVELNNIPVDKLPAFDREILMAVAIMRKSLVDSILRDSRFCEILSSASKSFIIGLSKIFSLESAEAQKKGVQKLLSTYHISWKAHWIKAHKMKDDGELNIDQLLYGCNKLVEKWQYNQQIRALEGELNHTSDENDKAQIALSLIEVRRKLTGLTNQQAPY